MSDEYVISRDIISKLWEHHNLGKIETIRQPESGIINDCYIVNEAYIIRFDRLNILGQSRYEGERMAYEWLGETNVPVPKMVAVDTSKSLVPMDYIILTKMEGNAITDMHGHWVGASFVGLDDDAGRYLAQIHRIEVGQRFGELCEIGYEDFETWFAYVEDFFTYYSKIALANAALEQSVVDRIGSAIQTMKPVLDEIKTARLVHGDYRFENMLEMNGNISAIFDFEWALAGDPMWDFRVMDKWDAAFPVSHYRVFRGYQEQGELGAGYQERVGLYQVLMYLDDVAIASKHHREKDMVIAHSALTESLIVLEALLALKAAFPIFYHNLEQSVQVEPRELSEPMSVETIEAMEVDLGVPLPESYKKFLRCTKTIWLDSIARLWEYPDSLIEDTLFVWDYNWEADGDKLCFDLSNGLVDGEYPVLYYAHDFGGDENRGLRKIANSFGEWLNQLQLDYPD